MSFPQRAFAIIGENVHATRSLSRKGRHLVGAEGAESIAFVDASGTDRTLLLAEPIRASAEFGAGKVKHIRNALLLGLGGDEAAPHDVTGTVDAEAAQAGRDYLLAAALRQERAGAHYIDVNVDEVADDPGVRAVAMDWLVRLLEPALAVPLALDSSSASILEAGLRASSRPRGPVLLNSASAERLDVLDLAAAAGSPVVLSAAGRGLLPATAEARLANALEIIAGAQQREVPLDAMHVDVLVVPVGVDPGAGTAYLEAARRLRAEFGSAVRITGGLSNVSFGLPNRRLLNDVFVALAIDAGVDSGIVDPITTRVAGILAADRDDRSFSLAADVLTGRDEYAMEYLTAFRGGELRPGLNADAAR